jgi:hypothetical protein
LKIKKIIVSRNIKLNVGEYESINPSYGEEVLIEEDDDIATVRKETVSRVNHEFKRMVWKELQEVHSRRTNERDEATEAIMSELIEYYQPQQTTPSKKKKG